MSFNSIIFAVFLPIVFALYWSLNRAPLKLQNLLVIVASYVFYGWWDWRFLGLIFVSSLTDYLVGRGLARTEDPRRRKALLVASLVVNFALLGFFKYFNFFADSFASLLTGLGMQVNPSSLAVILPVGISFYTFQTLSYTVDVYRRKVEPTRDPIAFFAFVSFFPQLVAGPIERARNLLPQFARRREFDLERAKDGMRQILGGLFKKICIADFVARSVNTIFTTYARQDGIVLLGGVFLFAVQIYCDFAGYSDIAIGTARLFGFDLMRNFAYPYFSRNIAEFWRRWHVSLSSWFRDYVYYPLGGPFGSKARQVFGILVTFTLSGLWHGANWTFVFWGFLNGCYYVPLILAKNPPHHKGVVAKGRRLPTAGELFGMLGTFGLVLLGWVFFRSETFADALAYLGRMFSAPYVSGVWHGALLQPVAVSVAFFVAEWIQRRRAHVMDLARAPRPLRWAAYYAVFLVAALFGTFGGQEFIYFQF
ncbi:MAG: acyltransferase [Candidatus Coatesbacteria bacterium RBG_13_66_14]|uniref:Acyltransferase n=1 Tax=Candidatus Coatesbacteria bacterium RBG_13_66_14 TaxID=1817816 RepID=A0A1F5FES7_9BACT|nr:MAG: acyltransferase [Candidatus Coatesbacteria bacterium RBG_13_66_14]